MYQSILINAKVRIINRPGPYIGGGHLISPQEHWPSKYIGSSGLAQILFLEAISPCPTLLTLSETTTLMNHPV